MPTTSLLERSHSREGGPYAGRKEQGAHDHRAGTDFKELGDRIDKGRVARQLVRRLEKLGYEVKIEAKVA